MIWKQIINTDYEVSECGMVRNSKTGYVRKQSIGGTSDYKLVSFRDKDGNKKNNLVHRLVAVAFLDKPNGKDFVNHKDGNKLNNKPTNLEYVTIAENIKHSIRHGMHICNRPEELSSYKDGRTRDKVKYKHEWYLKNRKKILEKAKNRYYSQKEGGSSLI